MLNSSLTNVFSGTNPATSVQLLPIVSIEWNQNLFNQPYITVSGTGVSESIGSPSGATVTDATSTTNGYPGGLTTKTFQMSTSPTTISYSFSTPQNSPAYKIITYVQTDSDEPIQLNSYANGSYYQFGSTTVDVNAFGYVKVITYVGSSSATDIIKNLTYNMSFNTYNSSDLSQPINIYYTVPEVYPITYYDYENHSLWPTDSVFSYFRPGESYVPSGNVIAALESNFRQIQTEVISGITGAYPPVTPIIQNPQFTLATQPVPLYKNVLPSDLAPYKYYVSDTQTNAPSQMVTGIYQPSVYTNKIVLKFNTIQTSYNVNVALDGTVIASNVAVPANGVLILYYNGSTWSTTPWTTMPVFEQNGSISILKEFSSITVSKQSYTVNSEFSSYNSTYVSDDMSRFHLIEISPRIEVDVSQYVMELDINKQLDSKNNYIPISSINPNDAELTLSAIPNIYNNSPVPVFSSQNQNSVLYNMMRKNIKFYFGWKLESYFQGGEYYPNSYIPAGVYWSNAWDETDIQTVKVSCYDVVNYLQMVPTPDYVASNKSIFDILTNLMDMAGFTDYDYDSLYSVTHDSYTNMDMYYYFCNSQDNTLYDSLSELFLAHQIGAYIDEWGVMQFLSLTDIMRYQTPTVSFNDNAIIQGGYSITNKTKPGTITVSYQEPKVTQSLALQNATVPGIQNSPSFIYTTSNEVLWTQKDVDAVGSNYLSQSMAADSNYFQMNNNSLLDIFHTYLLNTDGYAVIENEIVSFLYKEYIIGQTSTLENPDLPYNPSTNTFGTYEYFYPKTDLELASYINQFIKQHRVGLKTNASSLNGTPTSNGYFIPDDPLDVTVVPTGKIANVQRGLFGTFPSDHNIISSSISEKGLTSNGDGATGIVNINLASADNPKVAKISVTPNDESGVYIYNPTITNPGFNTYSCKFDLNGIDQTSGGVFFNYEGSGSTYYVNLVQINKNAGTNKAANYTYFITVIESTSGSKSMIAMVEATNIVAHVQQNWEKVLTLVPSTGGAGKKQDYSYTVASDQEYSLRVSVYHSDGSDGENEGMILNVYLNNIQVTGWQIPDTSNNNSIVVDDGTKDSTSKHWKTTGINLVNNLPKKVNISPTNDTYTGKFGFFTSIAPAIPEDYTYSNLSSSAGPVSAFLREIYACEKPLIERSTNYWYQDPEFLNGLIQNRNIFSKYRSYMMQTNPEVTGMNYYDIQYQTPAATSADVLPIEYLWYYFPGTQPTDQQYYQKQLVDEYSLSYSTPINTGFRARMAIINNVGHMVYLTHASDSVNAFTVSLNLWTHEVIAPSDAQTLQRVLDSANVTEAIQVDSHWIQSKQSANRLIDVITIGNDGFSRDTAIQVWGNPLIQVGDIINLTYSLAGISNAKYLVHEVAHVYNKGLKTTLTLNSLNKAVNPTNQ